MSLIGIQKFIHSQIVKIENEIAINDYELKQIIPEAIEILKNNFANHACNEQEKEILNDIYKDIQILTKESKEHVLFDLKKRSKASSEQVILQTISPMSKKALLKISNIGFLLILILSNKA